jgi:anti-sigma-K factor RskA
MSEADHTRWKDDVAAYVLGALEPDEGAELERHLEGCTECRAELRWLQPAVDLLPEKVERVDAPGGLRAKIVEQVREEAAAAATDSQRRMPFSRRRWLQGWRPIAAAGLVALILAGVAGYAIRGGEEAGGGATTVAVGEAPAVTAKLVMEGDSATLKLANVEAMPGDKVLEAWVQRDGEVERAGGLFVPDRAGRATAMIPDMHGVEAVMVTSEPEGGSAKPTSSPMVTAKIETG